MTNIEKAKSEFEDGINYYLKKNFSSAEMCFLNALKEAPQSIPILENLSKTFMSQKKFNEAEIKLKYMISLDKKGSEVGFKLLFDLYKSQNEYEKLNKITDLAFQSLKISKKNMIENKFFYPNNFKSRQENLDIRSNFEARIDIMLADQALPKLSLDEIKIKPPIHDLWGDGLLNININKKIVRLLNKIYPEFKKYNSSINLQSNNSSKIRIGFISQFFTDHSIMKFYEGVIYNIDKSIFEVFVFHSEKTIKGHRFERMWSSCIYYNFENIILPKKFDEKIKEITDKKLDILFYPDIHLSTNLYYLTFVRLAKIQITSIGHSDTTGNDKIDYFLTSELIETENYKKKYSEKILLSKLLPIYYYRPKVQEELNKSELTKKNIYFCPQSLFKIDLEFDLIVKKILEKDKFAKIYFIKDREKNLFKNLTSRLGKIIPENIDRVFFLDRLNSQEFINFCGSSSVLINPLNYHSGNSFFDSLYYGTPFFANKATEERSSIVQGGYKQMKIQKPPLFSNVDDYVDNAVEIANKDIYDLKMFYRESAIKYLYENLDSVREIEKIFKSIRI